MGDRDSGPSSRRVRFGVFEADLKAGELRKNGLKIRLPGQPFEVLAMMLERPGEVVTREELQKRLWPDGIFVDFDHSLNNAINKIREALADSAESPRFVETLSRRGYRFIAPVSNDAAPSQPRGPSPSAKVPYFKGLLPIYASGRRNRVWVGAVLVVLAIAVGVWLFRGSPGKPQPVPEVIPAMNSLAVLPLRNLSDDPEQVYFVDGMTDALISHLGKIKALRVISRTSAMQYKETRKRLPEIAKELDVQALLEGSVLRSSDRVRITVRLIEAATDRQVWAQSYEGDLQDVLALQSKVAGDVAREIGGTVIAYGGTPLTARRPTNPEAYDAYLKGLHHLGKRNTEGFRKALEFFKRAIAKDSNYAPAYAGLADLYDLLASYALLVPKQAYPNARAAALKALTIDDQLAEAHTALAKVRVRYDLDWQGAEREFLRAIELNPGYAPAHYGYGVFYLAATAQFDKAIAELEQAQRQDPLSMNINTELGLFLFFAGKNDEATERLQKALEIDPDFMRTHNVLGRTYFNKGMFEPAIAELEKAATLSKDEAIYPVYLGSLGFAYGALGHRQEASRTLEKLLELGQQRYVPSDCIAEVYAGLGEKTQALMWLEKAYEERSRKLIFVKVDPTWKSLRDNPQFKELVRRIGPKPL